MDMYEFESTPMATQFPEAVRLYLGLRPLEEILDVSIANGVSRLLTCPPFEPVEALTLTFFDREVIASHVVSDEGAWERIACAQESANDTVFVARERPFRIADLPTEMQGWLKIADVIERSESCMSDNPDGISYFHITLGNGIETMRVWFNPTEVANPSQWRLLNGYSRIKASL